ncbi:hypothetical protein ACOSP7_026818 [Xanthoceras sorbifolium]
MDWIEYFPASVVTHLEYWKSDYRPLLIEVLDDRGVSVSQGVINHRRFQFEECWANDRTCMDIVEQTWQYNGMCDASSTIQQSISACSSQLQNWYKTKNNNLLRGIQ